MPSINAFEALPNFFHWFLRYLPKAPDLAAKTSAINLNLEDRTVFVLLASTPYGNPTSPLHVECSNNAPSFLLHGNKRIELISALPANWNGRVIAGGQTFSYKGNLGEMVIQVYRKPEWEMRFVYAHFSGETELRWRQSPMLQTQFALQGKFVHQTSLRKTHMRAGTMNSFWPSDPLNTIVFSKNTKCQLFQILYKPDFVKQLIPGFPNTGKPDEKNTSPIEKEWMDTIHQILDCPYDAETRNFFYENRVRDVLLYAMLRPGAGIRYEGLSDEDVRKIHEVDAIILEDLRTWLHIPALAKKVHLSEFKLKMAFKQVIGVNLFERLRDARLEKARQLLMHTDMQVKTIFREIGYKSLSGFEEAFKDKYGMGPSKYRALYSTQP
ncbi:MAG: helix-turn-helix transcriptional regulator [Williamsia sp.]|nr:helix-turn-helix transcriptional regulator [Williamsia sp.]